MFSPSLITPTKPPFPLHIPCRNHSLKSSPRPSVWLTTPFRYQKLGDYVLINVTLSGLNIVSWPTTKSSIRHHALTAVVGATCPSGRVGWEWDAVATAAASTARCTSTKVCGWPGPHRWNTGSRAYAILAVVTYLIMENPVNQEPAK